MRWDRGAGETPKDPEDAAKAGARAAAKAGAAGVEVGRTRGESAIGWSTTATGSTTTTSA